MKTFGKCKLAPTSSHIITSPMPHSLSQALLTCILVVTPEEKRLSKLDGKAESVEREKQLKKEIAGNFLCAGEEMLFVDSKVN